MANEDVQKTLAELSRDLQESKARLEEAQRVAHSPAINDVPEPAIGSRTRRQQRRGLRISYGMFAAILAGKG
jgi:hypothetical protein